MKVRMQLQNECSYRQRALYTITNLRVLTSEINLDMAEFIRGIGHRSHFIDLCILILILKY